MTIKMTVRLEDRVETGKIRGMKVLKKKHISHF